MPRKKELWQNVVVSGMADKGMAVGKDSEGRVVFLQGAVPGDVVDARILKKKKGVWQGITENIVQASTSRVDPPCRHFADCGGCKWQDLSYEAQVREKEQIVHDVMKRLAKIEVGHFDPIAGADKIYHYRNKMEYSFSNQRWKTKEEVLHQSDIRENNALGLHPPRFFNKVVDIDECWLQEAPSNRIRNFIRQHARDHGLPFFDPVNHTGYLRNMILRNSTLGEWMLILSMNYSDEDAQIELLESVRKQFPQITSLQYVINRKKNDTLFDQEIMCYSGKDHIMETMGSFHFKIRPKSFFQTNVFQARKLYDLAVQYADLDGDETVYDLYTGTGTIALYMSQYCRHVVGIEEIEDAIRDARENAEHNQVQNASFYVGDVKKEFNEHLFQEHGRPDVVITDPPRNGMDSKVIDALLTMKPSKVVYISCNPATQARDLALLDEVYSVDRMQPVDMFPHTHHIENIARLTLRI